MKRIIGNSIASGVATIVGLGTMWASATRLKAPDSPLDWIVLFLSGITTGTLAFFVIWGHFQQLPTPNSHEPDTRQ